MMRIRFILLAAAVVTLILTAASAALSQHTFSQKNISLNAALTVAQGALDKCRADGFKVSVTVLDAADEVKVYIHDDEATQLGIEGSRHKAYTALVFRQPSGEVGKARGVELVAIEGTSGTGGGVPIKEGNDYIGAVGVGGGTAPGEDERCANAGIAKMESKP